MENKNRRFIFIFLIFLFQTVYLFSLMKNNDLRFVIVIPSYNNKNWYERNLDSVLSQRYKKYRVIYLDDCSSDGTGELVQKYIDEHSLSNKITLIKNAKRKGALANLYCAIHSCDDNEIIVNLDGDDWFAHEKVLSILARTYRDTNVWLAYSQYIDSWGGLGCCRKIDQDVIRQNLYRQEPNVASHLRTFYAWLFKEIKLEDLLYHGAFFPMAWDWAMMYPMLEMSGGRFKFIPNILYIYNIENPINDSKIDEQLQIYLSELIQQKKPYQPLKKPAVSESEKMAICSLIVIANNDTSHLKKVIDQLQDKQLCTISSVYIFCKNRQEKSTINQIFFKKNDMTEFTIVVSEDYLGNLYARLDEFILLLRQTEVCVCTLVEPEQKITKKVRPLKGLARKMRCKKNILGQKQKKNVQRIKFKMDHYSPLYESIYTYQLGWKPDVSTKHSEQGYIFSLKFFQKHAQELPDLLDDHYKLSQNFKQIFSHCAGLLVELVDNKENNENR